MEHINEDKRKTEKQMHMFELIRDIEDVPATVLSSHHWFISRHDVLELNISNNGKTNKPLSIALFLFSDSIEFNLVRQSDQSQLLIPLLHDPKTNNNFVPKRTSPVSRTDLSLSLQFVY
ncbi:PREDICTED: protein ECT2-like [Amphimedon queenslandica]|uniref:Uncharacterized protein n=1 Tax=Amphimedon queenslandica TaxID=400682 RepID=A0AAN0JF38_AMPQE|nr:PREDICTED: protein ECT2-like [Amphimedon queenslandica]|eukprot:XP_019855293.1 PREDICTED: protein ECT2-like [Amphimedon queenslandica]